MEFENFMSKILIQNSTTKFHLCTPQLHLHQNEFLKFIQEYNDVIVYKKRQEGTSTAMALYIFWYMIVHPGTQIAFMGSESSRHDWTIFSDLLRNNKKRFKDYYKIGRENSHDIKFTNKSRAILLPYSKSSGCGWSLDMAYVSEFRYVKEEDKEVYLMALMQMLHQKSGKLIITTDELGTRDKFFGKKNYRVREFFYSTYSGRREILFEKFKDDKS